MGNEVSDLHHIDIETDKYHIQDEKDEKDEYKYVEDDDDVMQECLIDPDKDRRQPIHSSPNKDDGIIQCIGSLRITFNNNIDNPPEKKLGSGTVIYIDDKNFCYVLTAAHNYLGTLRQCRICNKKTIETRCLSMGCNRRITRKITPAQLIEADSIYFQRRCIKRDVKLNNESFKFGHVMQSYQIVKCKLRKELYNKYSQAYSGYDLCIMVFKCKDKDEIDLYRSNCNKMQLVCDPFLGKKKLNSIGKNQLNIYGYPGEKFNGQLNDKQFEMWGMSSSAMKGHNMKIIKNIETGKAYILNGDIDTTGGQSGACIWALCEKHNDEQFIIYGVHSGGFSGLKKKKTVRANVATFLDDDNLKWIEEQISGLKGHIIESVHMDLPISVDTSDGNLYVQYLVSIYVNSNGCTIAYCTFGASSDVHLASYCNNLLNRCPASLLMDKTSNIPVAIGFEADKLFTEQNEKDKYAYFQHIEHYLYNNEHFDGNSCVVSAGGELIISIADLTTHFLDEIINHALSDINNTNKLYGISRIIDRNDIFLITSIPSTWNEYDKKLMGNCINKLKLLSFDFVPDVVAASFCTAELIDKTIVTTKGPFVILNCHANKTTLAIIENSYSQFQFKIIHKDKISIGSVNVGDSFLKLLQQLLPSEIINLVEKSHPQQWQKQKKMFLQSMHSCPWDLEGYWNVSFCAIIQQYIKRKKLKKRSDLTYNNMKSQIDQYKIPNTGICGAFKFTQYCLKINKKGWLYLCEESLIDIIQFLKKNFKNSKAQKCKKIVLMGDFGKSQGFASELLKGQILASRLQHEFPNKTFLKLSCQAEIAVVKGGLHWICEKGI